MKDRPRGYGPPSRGPRPSAGAPARGRLSGRQAAVKAKVDELVKTTGIPRQLAFQVAMGNLALNDVLERLAREDKAQAIMDRHGLDRSVAVQIALGQASLDNVLRKKRLEAHLTETRRKGALTEAATSGRRVAVALHGRRVLRGLVREVTRYEFVFVGDEAAPETIHKLQVKFVYPADEWKTLAKAIGKDAARDADVEPIARPQDRFTCSDKQLFAHLEAHEPLTVTTLEGDEMTGIVSWVGRWEFGLLVPRKKHATDAVEVVVFRHALADLRSA